MSPYARLAPLAAILPLLHAVPASAQLPVEGEVRQIVSFTVSPGAAGEVVDLYRDRALPLYRDDDARLNVRVFREVESPRPLDLVVVSGFEGMDGMDRSNDALRAQGIASVYGEIAARTTGHTDEFVEMLPRLGGGDPAAAPLTVFVRYRLVPGSAEAFETALIRLSARERDLEIPAVTGRFLISDGWNYLRILGFDSLGAYQAYRLEAELARGHEALTSSTVVRQEMVLAAIRNLDVR
jgi:hypothetical protein